MEQGQGIKGFVDRHGIKHVVEQQPVGRIGDDTASVAASDNFVSVIADNGGVSVDAASLNLNIHNEESGVELNITPKEAANLYRAAQDWDEDPTEGSPNIVTSDGIYCALDGKMNVPNNIIITYDGSYEILGNESAFNAAVLDARYFSKIVSVKIVNNTYVGILSTVFNQTNADSYDVTAALTIGNYVFTMEGQYDRGQFVWGNQGSFVVTKEEFIMS